MYSKSYTFYKYVDYFFRPYGEIFHKVNVNIVNTILTAMLFLSMW